MQRPLQAPQVSFNMSKAPPSPPLPFYPLALHVAIHLAAVENIKTKHIPKAKTSQLAMQINDIVVNHSLVILLWQDNQTIICRSNIMTFKLVSFERP